MAEKAPSARVRYLLFSAENANELLDAGKVPDPHGGIWVGVPSMAIYNTVNYRVPAKNPAGVGAHRDYLCVLPSSGKEILEWVKVARDIHDREGFELFRDFHMHERHVVCSLIAFDKTNPEQRRAVNQIWYNQHREATERGYGVARTHVNNMDVASEGFDWNNHAYRRFVESLKDTADPDGILSPGKMGIWPKRLRVDKARF